MDSNHRSLSRGSRFILRKVNFAGIDGRPKKFLTGYRWFESISLQRGVMRTLSPSEYSGIGGRVHKGLPIEPIEAIGKLQDRSPRAGIGQLPSHFSRLLSPVEPLQG